LAASRACRLAFLPRAFLRTAGFACVTSGVDSFDGRDGGTGVCPGRMVGVGRFAGTAVSGSTSVTCLGNFEVSFFCLLWCCIMFSVPQAEHCTHLVVEVLPPIRCCRVCLCSPDLTTSHDHPTRSNWPQALQTSPGMGVSTSCETATSVLEARMNEETVGALTASVPDACSRKRRRASTSVDTILITLLSGFSTYLLHC
jgi:hypothetical protein